jgi:hypothetical protein
MKNCKDCNDGSDSDSSDSLSYHTLSVNKCSDVFSSSEGDNVSNVSKSCSVFSSESCDSSSSDSCSVSKSCSLSDFSSCSVSESFSLSKSCSDSNVCDSNECDNSCELRFKPVDLNKCPTDCDIDCKEKDKPFNIYWFGSDYSDVGNGSLVMGLPEYHTKTFPLGPECPELEMATGPCGRSSNGKVYPQFIGEDLCLDVVPSYDVCDLPINKNTLLSFALSGALQSKNVNTMKLPTPPGDQFGFDYQIEQYLNMYYESTCYAFPENDLFFLTDVGMSEQTVWFNQVSQLPVVEWLDALLILGEEYKTKVMENIDDLYNLGKARRLYVLLADSQLINILPLAEKITCFSPDGFEVFLEAISLIQESLRLEIMNYAQDPNVCLDVTVIDMSGAFSKIHDNPSAFGVTNTQPTGLPPLVQTMVSEGWPEKVFDNMMWFDDVHPTEHTHRVVANLAKTWFQQY